MRAFGSSLHARRKKEISMVRLAAFGVFVALLVAFPGAPQAAADDKAPAAPAAEVTDIAMTVDTTVDGKTVSSPGGHEVQLSAAKCPLKIQFKGKVTVDKPTKITYRWEWSDGTMMPKKTFDVKTAGEAVEITPPDTWNVGRPGGGFHSVEILHILAPNEMSSSTSVRVACGS
jgi:hypothetical protein